MKKIFILLLGLLSIGIVEAQRLRIYFHVDSKDIIIDNNMMIDNGLICTKDNLCYAEYDSASTISNINSISGNIITLKKDNKKQYSGNEWYVTGSDNKKHYYSNSKSYKVENIIDELALSKHDYMLIIDLYPNFESLYKTIIKYNANGGKLDSKHSKAITISFTGIIKKNNKELLSKVENNGDVNLYNVNNPRHINLVRKGYYLDTKNAWNTKKDGTGKSFSQYTIYKTSDFCDSSKKDCTITLYANWKKIHNVKIKYNINGGEARGASVENNNITIDKKTGTIKCKGKEYCHTLKSNSQLSSSGLMNYDNDNNLSISKNGYDIMTNFVWNTKKDGTGKSYNQKDAYKASDFCDSSKKDCTVTLYANWVNVLKPKFNGNPILENHNNKNDISAQSISISDDGLYAYVFMTEKSNDYVHVDIYHRNSLNDNFKYNISSDRLSYEANVGYTLNLEHANGSTYYKVENENTYEEYLLVTTKINNEPSKYVIKYRINNEHNNLSFDTLYNLNDMKNVIGITYDNNGYFYVSSSYGIRKFDTNFVEVQKIPKNINFYENQDITYHNNRLYYGYIIKTDNYVNTSNSTKIPLTPTDNLITVVNAEDGNFVKYIVFEAKYARNYISNKAALIPKDIRLGEVEDIVFIDNKPYCFVQKGGNAALVRFDGLKQ